MDRQRLEMFAFEGGQPSRRRNTASLLLPSESSKYQVDRITMLKAARQHAENIGFVKSILLKVATYVAGYLEYQPNTGDPAIDAKYKEHFANWCLICDMTGRNTFIEITMLVIYSILRDGDIGAEWCSRPGFYPGLNMIESDRIGGPYLYTTEPKRVGGIILDSWGKPVSYQVYDRTPDGQYPSFRDVPAASFIHAFDPMRVDQYRGITAFHAALNSLQDIHEVLENEILAVKWASAQGGVVENESGADESGAIFGDDEKDVNDNTLNTQAIEPAAITFIKQGGAFKSFEYNRPSPAFQGLIKLLYREVALALNLPYGFVYDLGELSGPSVRMDSAQAGRTFERWQDVILVNKWLNPCKNRCLMDGIQNWGLPDHPNFMRGTWRFPAHVTIDAGRDSAAAISEVRAGMRSKRTWFTENQWSPEVEEAQIDAEARATIQRAKRIAADEGVPIEMVLPYLDLRTPNAPVAPEPTEKKDEEKKDEGTNKKENGDGGGLETVVDILTAYGVGVRAGAITPNVDDENLLRSKLSLSPISEAVRSAWNDEKVRRPITLAPPEGTVTPAVQTPDESETRSPQKKPY